MSLIFCCSVCGKRTNLLRCSACKVTPYCSRDHQISDREHHTHDCKAIKKERGRYEREEKMLRESPGDWMTPANPLENSVGHFWGILATRDYMRARYGFVEALLKIKTLDAVKSAADHLRDMLRLCRSDNLGVRDLLPALYLRLGRDQDCYDFIKWWLQRYYASDYDCGDTSAPYLDIVNADVFESPESMCKGYSDLSHLVCVTLLKLKLLFDVEALHNSIALRAKIPQEIVDRVKIFVPRSELVRGNAGIMSRTEHKNLIQDLSAQIELLFNGVNEANSHFWGGLIYPGSHLDVRPEYMAFGSIDEMQVKLQYCYDSWNETPGAVDFIKAKVEAAS